MIVSITSTGAAHVARSGLEYTGPGPVAWEALGDAVVSQVRTPMPGSVRPAVDDSPLRFPGQAQPASYRSQHVRIRADVRVPTDRILDAIDALAGRGFYKFQMSATRCKSAQTVESMRLSDWVVPVFLPEQQYLGRRRKPVTVELRASGDGAVLVSDSGHAAPIGDARRLGVFLDEVDIAHLTDFSVVLSGTVTWSALVNLLAEVDTRICTASPSCGNPDIAPWQHTPSAEGDTGFFVMLPTLLARLRQWPSSPQRGLLPRNARRRGGRGAGDEDSVGRGASAVSIPIPSPRRRGGFEGCSCLGYSCASPFWVHSASVTSSCLRLRPFLWARCFVGESSRGDTHAAVIPARRRPVRWVA